MSPSANVFTSELPDPQALPNADIVVFDGQCVFCRGQVERLRRWDGGQRLAFLSLHDPRVGQRFPDLTHEQLMTQMYVITPEGKRYGGAAALRYLSRRLPRLWWLAPLLHLPGTLPCWSFLYRQVAQRRYRLAGSQKCESGQCQLHFGDKS